MPGIDPYAAQDFEFKYFERKYNNPQKSNMTIVLLCNSLKCCLFLVNQAMLIDNVSTKMKGMLCSWLRGT